MKYMIYGKVDNTSPNKDIFFITEDKNKADEIYKKLQRLNSLQFPNTKELKEEYNKLYEELKNEGIEIFSDEELLGNSIPQWNLNKQIEFEVGNC